METIQPVKLNLGCGTNRMTGYINVDKYGEADLICDLEDLPWPWDNNSIDEIILHHVLEHLGETTENYLSIIFEMYRVLKPNAVVKITVPHPRHDDFINDPTHVRAITPDNLSVFSKKLNHLWIENNASNTPLGIYLDVDFDIKNVNYAIDEPWFSKYNAGEINDVDIFNYAKKYNNVIKEIYIEMNAIK